jgi:phosphatidylinositol alpha 1,6-mannosyltransferase
MPIGMRIVYFTESLLPHIDGVSATLARLFDALERRAVDFLVVSPFVPDPSVEWHRRVRGAPYVRFPPYPVYRVSFPYRGITKELDRFAPHLVHITSPTPMAIWAQRYARRRDVPVVTSFHTHFVSYFAHYGIRRLERAGWAYLRWFYGRCRRTYVPSVAMQSELAGRGFTKLELWSRGVDADQYSPVFRDEGLREASGAAGKPLLLFTGRLVKEKNLEDLIEANNLLRARGHDYVMAFVGDGPMRRRLKETIPDACLPGTQAGAQLARWYASADIFVFPSTTETFGNVILEAAASGVPAVAAAVGGPADLVQSGVTGLLARPGDPRDLADQIERMLVDPEARCRMGVAARREAAVRDWQTINGRLIESYTRVVAEHGTRES